jgi:hypothetical protein
MRESAGQRELPMNGQVPRNDVLFQYLLGKLPSERLEAIEQQILLDDDFHQEMKIAEEELLDNYIYGKLNQDDRQLFETNFLASDLRQQQLRFALALKRKVGTEKRRSYQAPAVRSFNRYAYALAASILLAAILGLLNYRLTQQLKQEYAQVSLLKKELEVVAQQHNAPVVAQGWGYEDAVVLAYMVPGVSRGEKLQEIRVPAGIRAIQFSLQVPGDLGDEVTLALLNDAGHSITTVPAARPQKIDGKNVIIATLSTELLKTGNYFVKISGKKSNSTQLRYAFKVLTP